MDIPKLDSRKKILFADDKKSFDEAKNTFLENVEGEYRSGDTDSAIRSLVDMSIDLHSFLTEWKLDRWISPLHKENFIKSCLNILDKWKAEEALNEIYSEANDIKNCRMAQLSRKTLSKELNVYWGHDKCDEIDYSLRRGASFTTSNPGKINNYRLDHPEHWNTILKEVLSSGGQGLSDSEVLSKMTFKIVSIMANYMRPIFDSTGGQYGFSSIQVDPRKWDDSQAMVDEIIFWYESFREELKTKTPNITFKVPATPAAVAASEIICSEYAKIRLCATSCFSLKQQSEFYEVFKNRNPAGLLVIVDVHLRTFSKPEFEALGVKDVEKYCELLVSQIYSKSYQQLRQKGLDIQLNGAGIRDSQGVKNNLTSDMALPVTFTIMPEVVREFNKNKIDLVDSIISKASKEEMKILETSKIFKQAYYEDAFPWEEINSFPPYSFMMDAFIESYNKCLEAIKSFRDKEVTK